MLNESNFIVRASARREGIVSPLSRHEFQNLNVPNISIS